MSDFNKKGFKEIVNDFINEYRKIVNKENLIKVKEKIESFFSKEK